MNWRRRDFLKSLSLAVPAACAGAHTAWSADSAPTVTTPGAPWASWFRVSPEVLEDWALIEVPGDPNRVQIRRHLRVAGAKLIVVLYPRPSSAYDIAISKILNVFDEKGIDAEFRVVNFGNDDTRGREALALAHERQVDLIFSMGPESTAWPYKHYAGGSIPVVSVCSKDPVELGQVSDYESGSGINFAFTSLNMPIEVQMAYIMELKPNLRNIGILVDGKNVSAMQTQALPMGAYARKQGVQVMDLVLQNPAEAKAEMAKLVPAAVRNMRRYDQELQNSLFWITGSTAVFREIAVINAHSDRVPVISAVPEVVGPGDDSAVLSVGISFESNAHLAAVYGADVLSGRARAGDLKVGIVTPPDIAINFRRARAIGLAVPFTFFEAAGFIYDQEGRAVRNNGKKTVPAPKA